LIPYRLLRSLAVATMAGLGPAHAGDSLFPPEIVPPAAGPALPSLVCTNSPGCARKLPGTACCFSRPPARGSNRESTCASWPEGGSTRKSPSSDMSKPGCRLRDIRRGLLADHPQSRHGRIVQEKGLRRGQQLDGIHTGHVLAAIRVHAGAGPGQMKEFPAGRWLRLWKPESASCDRDSMPMTAFQA
jgi:hypothetical protein